MKAGIVLVNKYCNANDKRFSGYISYIDRDGATRNDNMEKFNLYQDYMDNPEKSTGVFTEDKDFLTRQEKQNLKKVFQKAQENGSLMWQPVISFDNQWLEENGLYDSKTGILDEVKMKEFTRKSVGKMLHNENLDHAVWSASFHYNTDNIHIHVAVVEPVPMRQQKIYNVYDYIPDAEGDYIKSIYGPYLKATKKNQKYYQEDHARYRREEHLDQNGNPVKMKGYLGPFKPTSLKLCKSIFVNEVMAEKDYSIKLNSLIRNSIIKRKKEVELASDPELKEKFLELHAAMPDKGNRGLWNYNSNIMQPLRPKIDELSELYLQKYHAEDYQEFKQTVKERSELYQLAYGNTQRNYEEGKFQDLYTRLGNVILKEIREYDKQNNKKKERENKDNGFFMDENNGMAEVAESQSEDFTEPVDFLTKYSEKDPLQNDNDKLEKKSARDSYYKYFKERKKIYQELHEVSAEDIETVISDCETMTKGGNPLTAAILGNIYKKGILCEINLEKAEQYYKIALDRFFEDIHSLYDDIDTADMKKNENTFDLKSYLAYQVGKHYLYGLGTEVDYNNAIEWLEKADNAYAKFTLGNMYYFGKGTDQDYKKAFSLYQEARGLPFAALKLARMYEAGQGTKNDLRLADQYYESAFFGFRRLEKKQPDDNIEYQLGVLLYEGKGCEKDIENAKFFLKLAADKKNEQALYKLGMIYINENNIDEIKKGMEILKELADSSNSQLAQYALGKLYVNEEDEFFDLSEGINYLEKAAEQGNQYAEYTLGKLYIDPEKECYDIKKGVFYLERSVDQGNEMAKFQVAKVYLDKTKEVYAPEQGIKYIAELANTGNEYAQLRFGIEYLKGEHIEKNREEAYKWLNCAAEQGNIIAMKFLQDKNGGRKQFPLKAILRETIKANMKSSYQVAKAIRVLKHAMDEEYTKTHRQNQLEYEQLTERE